jgi:hypothetical protein
VKNLFDVTMPKNMKPKTIAAANAVRDHCPPKDATIGKAVDMLRKAITDHPTQAALSGAALLDNLGRSIEHLTIATDGQPDSRVCLFPFVGNGRIGGVPAKGNSGVRQKTMPTKPAMANTRTVIRAKSQSIRSSS